MEYGGFWIRFGAYLIDAVILSIAQAAIFAVFGQSMFDPESGGGIANIVSLLIALAYFVGFDSSDLQGTPGKRALGLIITDLDGRKITPLRAIGRYFAKLLSGLFLAIGYIMIAFTERKQGLHDIICSTLVYKGNPGDTVVDSSVFE